MLYEVINPSDSVTFKAEDPKVAVVANILVGKGNYGIEPQEKGQEKVEAMGILLFRSDAIDVVQEYIGADINKFIEDRRAEVVAALRSFSYATRSERATYEDAMAAITDPEKAAEFRAKHEDRERTSMNRIVKRAWSIADSIEAKHPATT